MRYSIDFAQCIPLVLLSLALLGCPPAQPTIEILPSSVQLDIGEVFVLTATPSRPGTVVWESSDETVVQVNAMGRLVGATPGEAIVTATLEGTTANDTATVSVTPEQAFNTSLPTNPGEAAPYVDATATVEECDAILTIPNVAARVVRWGDTRYHKLDMAGAGKTDDTGKAQLPFITLLFAAPVNADTGEPLDHEISVTIDEVEEIPSIQVYPAQLPAWDQEEGGSHSTPMFTRDPQFYASSQAYPGIDYEDDSFQIGNLHVVRLKVYPCQYIPVQRRLDLAKKMNIHVEWPSAGEGSEPLLVGNYTGSGETAEATMAPWLVNSQATRVIDANDLTYPLAAIDSIHVADAEFQLLVITRPELFSEARELARHRQDQGWRVYLASLTDTTYPDADSIREFIMAKDDANTMEVRLIDHPVHCLRHILLFGDTELIPCFAGMNESRAANPATADDGAVSILGTDLYYSTIRGADDWPDVTIGRISVDDAAEAAVVVDKIIAYDELPEDVVPHRVAIYGLFQDDITAQATLSGTSNFNATNDDVTAANAHYTTEISAGEFIRPRDDSRDDDFAEVQQILSNTWLRLNQLWPNSSYSGTAELGFRDGQADRPFLDTAERVRTFLENAGVEVRYGYGRTDGPTPQRFEDGTLLPAELRTYAWNVDAADLWANWREGLDGIVLHRDHANWWGWGSPDVVADDFGVMDHPETAIYPFVMSINCRAGYFDAEMDTYRTHTGMYTDTTTGSDRESFCELLLRMQDSGCVAAFAACRNSQSGPNDVLTDGLFKCFYPDYQDEPLLPAWGDFPHHLLGYAAMYSKMYVALNSDTDAKALYYLQLFQLLGDPLTELRIPVAD